MLTFSQEIRLGDLILTASLLIASIGLFLNYFRYTKDSRIRRSEFLRNIFNDFYSDKELADAFKTILDGKFIFDKNKVYNSKDTMKIGRLLEFLDNVASLYFLKNIVLTDIESIIPIFFIVRNNIEVKKFFRYLDDQNKLLGINEKACKNSRNLCDVIEKRKNPVKKS
jgi:hypothetical protein